MSRFSGKLSRPVFFDLHDSSFRQGSKARVGRGIGGINLLFLVLFATTSVFGVVGTLPVPENIRTEGVPLIPTSLMEALWPYTEGRAALLEGWHPVKREMLISTRFGEVSQIHRVLSPGRARTQLTFFPDPAVNARYQPGDGNFVVFSKDLGGTERYQLYLYEIKTGKIRLLTDGRSRNTAPLWSHDGRKLVFSSTLRNGRDTDIYVMDPFDLQKAPRMLVEAQGGGWSAVDWSPDQKAILLSDSHSINESTLYLVNADTGAKERLTPADQQASYANASFSADCKGIYLTTDLDSEYRRLAYLNFATHQIRFLLPELKWDLESVALSKDGRRLAYVVNEEGASTLHIIELASMKEIAATKLALGVISNVRWHGNGRDLGLTFTSPKGTDVYSLDVEDGSLERWTYSESGGLNPDYFSVPELIHWQSFDGLTISGLLYIPPRNTSRPHPVIIAIHGGPEEQSRPGFQGRLNYYLNELGVAIILPNARGSSGYGKTFLKLDNGINREDSVKDIGALLDWIETRHDLNAQRVMVAGASYGGYMVLSSMVHFSDRLRCGIDVGGISNFVTFLEQTEDYRRNLRRAEYGDERDPHMREYLERISPANNATKITKPVFILQGRNDPRVAMTESEQMASAIRKNGGTLWYALAEDEGHGFAKKKNRDFEFAAEVLFIKKYLLK